MGSALLPRAPTASAAPPFGVSSTTTRSPVVRGWDVMTAPGKPFVRPVLPPRGADEEDAFVWGLLADARPDDVAALVSEALQAGRPQLAARLVGLLPEDVQD